MYSPASFHRRRWRAKNKERNLLAAVLSIVVIALLSTSLAQPRWFFFRGGKCARRYLGVYDFFYFGYFDEHYGEQVPAENGDNQSGFVYHGFSETLVNCVTPSIVTLMRVMIVLVVLGIVTSLFAFFVDTLGVLNRALKIIKRNAMGSIFTVIFCVTTIGFSYYVSTLIAHQQELTKVNKGTRVEVKFDISFYLVTAAGSVAVLASAANLLKRYPPDDSQDDSLLDEFDGLETFSVNYPRSDMAYMQYVAPPPPYTP